VSPLTHQTTISPSILQRASAPVVESGTPPHGGTIAEEEENRERRKETETSWVTELEDKMPNASAGKQQLRGVREGRSPIDSVREHLEITIAEWERKLEELVETMTTNTVTNATRNDALTGVDGILTARVSLEKTFEYIMPESRARMAVAMSEVTEKAFWEGHGKHFPRFFRS
jgi:hypothetical protein